jgi:hypothetical protein
MTMMKIKIFSRLFFATLLFGVTSFVAVNNVWAADEKPWNKAADFKLKVPEWTGNWSGNFQADRARELILDKAKVTNTDSVNDDVKNNGSNDEKKGSATSGNVAYTGPNSLTGEYYYGCNTGGNIFQQLACRAGRIGLGLRSVGYIIAGFGLLVFSFAALFGKVKWNVFATIMFSVFLLSMTFYVINTFARNGNSAWIAGIAPTGYDSAEQVDAPVQNVDGVAVPDAENNRPK